MNISRRDFGKVAAAAGFASALPASVVITGCSTTWIATLENDLPTIGNIAAEIFQVIATASGNGLLGAAAGPIITMVEGEVKNGLVTLQTIVNDVKANGSSASFEKQAFTVLSDIMNSFSTLLPSLGIKNSGLQTQITSVTGLVLVILNSISLLLPSTAAAAPAVHTAAQKRVSSVRVIPSMKDAQSLADAILTK